MPLELDILRALSAVRAGTLDRRQFLQLSSVVGGALVLPGAAFAGRRQRREESAPRDDVEYVDRPDITAVNKMLDRGFRSAQAETTGIPHFTARSEDPFTRQAVGGEVEYTAVGGQKRNVTIEEDGWFTLEDPDVLEPVHLKANDGYVDRTTYVGCQTTRGKVLKDRNRFFRTPLALDRLDDFNFPRFFMQSYREKGENNPPDIALTTRRAPSHYFGKGALARLRAKNLPEELRPDPEVTRYRDLRIDELVDLAINGEDETAIMYVAQLGETRLKVELGEAPPGSQFNTEEYRGIILDSLNMLLNRTSTNLELPGSNPYTEIRPLTRMLSSRYGHLRAQVRDARPIADHQWAYASDLLPPEKKGLSTIEGVLRFSLEDRFGFRGLMRKDPETGDEIDGLVRGGTVIMDADIPAPAGFPRDELREIVVTNTAHEIYHMFRSPAHGNQGLNSGGQTQIWSPYEPLASVHTDFLNPRQKYRAGAGMEIDRAPQESVALNSLTFS